MTLVLFTMQLFSAILFVVGFLFWALALRKVFTDPDGYDFDSIFGHTLGCMGVGAFAFSATTIASYVGGF